MPEQYTISGTLSFTNADPGGAGRAGFKVQAFDRDLPSLERRRGVAPQLLGEAFTDPEGRFQIEYSPQNYAGGEGFSLLGRARQGNPDVSFQVFDDSGLALIVRRIEALNREFRPEQLIFNAPPSLEVTLWMEIPQRADLSEYEQLLALVAPVIEDLPPSELTDDDMLFLTNELGFEQQPESQRHLEWLRRSSVLAEQTGRSVPTEAFYGWGRKDLPAAFAELVYLPMGELPVVLAKLTDLPAGDLTGALAAAVAENIIPAAFRPRLDDLVKQLKRRDLALYTVRARLEDAQTGVGLAGYSVTTLDLAANNADLGLDITDSEGQFAFDLYLPGQLAPDAPPHPFSFQVTMPGGDTLPVSPQATLNSTDLAGGAVLPIKIQTAAAPPAPLAEQLQQIQLALPPELSGWLSDHQITSFADIRRKGGLGRTADLPGADPTLVAKLDALADLDRVSPDVKHNIRLLAKGYDSVLAISDAPYSEFVDLASEEDTGLTADEAARLHLVATVQTLLLNTILVGLAADAANGYNLSASND